MRTKIKSLDSEFFLEHLFEEAIPVKYFGYCTATATTRIAALDRDSMRHYESMWCEHLGKGMDNHYCIQCVIENSLFTFYFSDASVIVGLSMSKTHP